MIDFITCLFTFVGGFGATFAICYGGSTLVQKLLDAAKARREHEKKVANLLERIETNTRRPQA